MTTNAEMKLAGNVLDELMGLVLETPGVDTKIVRAVEKRFTQLQEGMIYLLFSKPSDWTDEDEIYSLIVEQEDPDWVPELYAKLAALRTLSFEIVEGHAS